MISVIYVMWFGGSVWPLDVSHFGLDDETCGECSHLDRADKINDALSLLSALSGDSTQRGLDFIGQLSENGLFSFSDMNTFYVHVLSLQYKYWKTQTAPDIYIYVSKTTDHF